MKTYLEVSDIGMLEKAAGCSRDGLLIRDLFHLGCRISEVLAIRVEDIDFEQRTITILHLKRSTKVVCPVCGVRLSAKHKFYPGCGKEVGKNIKKEQEKRRIRVLPIDQDSLALLQSYIGTLSPDGSHLIFRINRHRAWQIIRDCARKAGLEPLLNPETGKIRGVSPHRLRDAFSVHAMKLDDSGDGLRLLQEHLGHMSFNTTARYRKIAGEEHRQWYEKLW